MLLVELVLVLQRQVSAVRNAFRNRQELFYLLQIMNMYMKRCVYKQAVTFIFILQSVPVVPSCFLNAVQLTIAKRLS